MSGLQVGIFDAATGEDMVGRIHPLKLTVSKDIERPTSNWSMVVSPDTDWWTLQSLLPMRSRLRFDMSRSPEDDGYGPTALSGLVKSMDPSWDLASGRRSISVSGMCLGAALTDYAVYYNPALVDRPEFRRYGGDLNLILHKYFATVEKLTGRETPGSVARSIIRYFLDKVPAGQSLVTNKYTVSAVGDLDLVRDVLEKADIATLKKANTIAADRSIHPAFGFDDEQAVIRWSQWVKDANLNLALLKDTSLEGTLWNAFAQYTWKPFQRFWTDTNPMTGRHELNYHSLPFSATPRMDWDEARQLGLSEGSTPTAILGVDELTNVLLSKSDADAVNLIWVVGDVLASGEDPQALQARSESSP